MATVAAVPAIEAATNSIEKSRSSEVKMSSLVDRLSTLDAFGNLPGYADFIANPNTATLAALLGGTDATAALPIYLALLTGQSDDISGLAAVDAIPVFQQVFGGDLDALTPTDTNPGYDALGALPLYVNAIGDPSAANTAALLDGIDATSAVTSYAAALGGDPSALANIDAVSAVPNIKNFIGNGDLSRETGLSGIDAFSALPTYHGLKTDGIGALAPDSTGTGGLDAFSAVPGLLGIPPADPAPDFPSNPVTLNAVNAAPEEAPELKQAAAAEPGDAKPAAKEEKKDNGNLGLFKPKTEVILPTGFGGGGPDNGMPGWNKMLKKLGVGGDESGGEGGGE